FHRRSSATSARLPCCKTTSPRSSSPCRTSRTTPRPTPYLAARSGSAGRRSPCRRSPLVIAAINFGITSRRKIGTRRLNHRTSSDQAVTFLSPLDENWPSSLGSSGPMHDLEQPSSTDSAHVVRTLRALELLATDARTAREIASALGVHRRTAQRLL